MRQEDAVAAIVAGDHGDPFSFLGMHPSEGSTLVRAFLPGARTVEVLSSDGDALGNLGIIHREGLFAGPVRQSAAYRLRVVWEDAEGLFYVPLATTAGALLRSYERGMVALTRAVSFGPGTPWPSPRTTA